jgi:NAD(P)H-hydrate epimerase
LLYTVAMAADIPKVPGETPDDRHQPLVLPAAYVFSREAIRRLDRLASERYGMPSMMLMENAAFHLADIAQHMLREVDQPRVLVACGAGNNGGDGLALARHLHNAGHKVEVLLAQEAAAYQEDAGLNLEIARRMQLSFTSAGDADPAAAMRNAIDRLGPPDLVVDALLGTGAATPVREPVRGLIREINRLAGNGPLVLSVDLPSGLDCDSGEPLGAAVHADVTVTFCGLKSGFLSLSAQEYIGDVVVVDIGAPRELTAELGSPLDQEPHRDDAPPPRAPGSGRPPRQPGVESED